MAHDLQMAMRGMMKALQAVSEAIDDTKNKEAVQKKSTKGKKNKSKKGKGASDPDQIHNGPNDGLVPLIDDFDEGILSLTENDDGDQDPTGVPDIGHQQ